MNVTVNPLRHWTSGDGSVRAALVFPSPDMLSGLPSGCVVSSTALLRLANGTIWLVKGEGLTLTETRIMEFAESVLALEEAMRQGSARRVIAESPEFRSLVIWDNISLRTISRQWGVGEYVATLGSIGTVGDQLANVTTSEVSIVATITEHLNAFMQTLEQEALSTALGGTAFARGAINIWIYNYLIDTLRGAYRQQFAATFPLMLASVACPATCDRFDESLHRQIDSGGSVTNTLSVAWGVRARVIRHLIGKTAAVVGTDWEGHLPRLARLLDPLPPEVFPSDDERQWSTFGEAVNLAEEWAENYKPPFPDIVSRALLREYATSGKAKPGDMDRFFRSAHKVAGAIGGLNRCLALVLAVEIETRHPGREILVERLRHVSATTLNALLMKGKLVEAAARFNQEFAKIAAGREIGFRIIGGTDVLPLLPSDFVSSNGKRRVKSLTNPDEFREQAKALSICLWDRPEYLRRCRTGHSYILAVLDHMTGQPVSTVEIGARDESWHGGRCELQVLSHLGESNEHVDDQSATAIDELLIHCNSPDIQTFIADSRHFLRELWLTRAARSRRQTDGAQLVPILSVSLGRKAYENAVKSALAAEFVLLPPPEVIDIDDDRPYPANVLSNTFQHSFDFDSVACGSVEGLLQAMKYSDESRQQWMCRLFGSVAQEFGKKQDDIWRATMLLWWKGSTLDRHGSAYQEFLDKVYRTLADQCAEFREGLRATGTATLVHSIGGTDPKQSILTQSEYCGALMRLRNSLNAHFPHAV